MREGSIRGLEVFDREFAALPGSYPIKVVAGEKIVVNRVTFQYIGPAQTLWVCWGLKRGTDFNNGDGLEQKVFASASFSVPNCTAWTPIDRTVSAVLTITPAMLPDIYDCHNWIATENTALESKIVLIDPSPDADIVKIMRQEIQNLEVAYAKV